MKLSLDKTWKRCLEMWEWIVDEDKYYPYSIESLKDNWIKKHYPNDHLRNDCYFCDYKNAFENDCVGCPGKLVDSEFDCMSGDYSYDCNPKEFLKKLKKLNKKRLSAKPTPSRQ
jgi:hypothetical protein